MRLARILEISVAGQKVQRDHTARRNRAPRFARRRGASVAELATQVGLGPGHVSKILRADTKRREKASGEDRTG